MAGRRGLLCRMLGTATITVSGSSRRVKAARRAIGRRGVSWKPHVQHLRWQQQRRLCRQFPPDKGRRDIPKRSSRPLRLALVGARPMCVPGLRPPAVSWIHGWGSQTVDRPMIDSISVWKSSVYGCLTTVRDQSRIGAAPRFARRGWRRMQTNETRAARVSKATLPCRGRWCCSLLIGKERGKMPSLE